MRDFVLTINIVRERQESSVTVGSDSSSTSKDEATGPKNTNKETISSSHVEDQDGSFSITVIFLV